MRSVRSTSSNFFPLLTVFVFVSTPALHTVSRHWQSALKTWTVPPHACFPHPSAFFTLVKMVDPITPLTEAPPANAPKAEDVAVAVDLPSRKNSADTFDGFKLEQIDPSSQVHPAHDVIRDRKTGKHYKKVTPSWSLAHAKAQQSGSSSNATKSHHNPKFSLAHSFGDKERDPGSVGSGVKTGSRTPPHGGGHLSAADIHTLVEQLRTVGECA